MNSVVIDEDRRTVRVGGGATWADVDSRTGPLGLATPSGIIATTGVGGLTLGGGIGYISRRYGLTIDSLLSAEVVSRTARPCGPAGTRTPTCTGRCVAAAATSGS